MMKIYQLRGIIDSLNDEAEVVFNGNPISGYTSQLDDDGEVETIDFKGGEEV